MTAPVDIRPAVPKRQRRAAKPQPTTAAELTTGQLHAAHLFGLMSDVAQKELLPMMESVAREMPRHTRPVLRLVGGGAK